MATVTQRAVTTANTAATPSTTLSIAYPTVQAGDLLKLMVAIDGGTGKTITTPAGWTLNTTSARTTDVRNSTYTKVATGTESGNLTVSFSASASACAIMASFINASYVIDLYGSSNAAATTTPSQGGTAVPSSGLSCNNLATYNTTGINTITVGAGWTKQAETSTTASPYISLTFMTAYTVLPIVGNTGTSTSSQTASYCYIQDFVLERKGYEIRDYTPFIMGASPTNITTGVSTIGSGSVKIYYPDTLVLMFVNINEAQTVTSITTSGFTWTKAVSTTANGIDNEIWYTWVKKPQTFFSATINLSGTVTKGHALIMNITGADNTSGDGSSAIGATAISSGTSPTPPSASVTTTVNNSLIVGSLNAAGNYATTAAANTTVYRSATVTSTVADIAYKNNQVNAGATAGIALTNTAWVNWDGTALEIKPIANSNAYNRTAASSRTASGSRTDAGTRPNL